MAKEESLIVKYWIIFVWLSPTQFFIAIFMSKQGKPFMETSSKWFEMLKEVVHILPDMCTNNPMLQMFT